MRDAMADQTVESAFSAGRRPDDSLELECSLTEMTNRQNPIFMRFCKIILTEINDREIFRPLGAFASTVQSANAEAELARHRHPWRGVAGAGMEQGGKLSDRPNIYNAA
jgi:hypothetical protein